MDKNLDTVPVSEWGIFTGGRPYVIAGPCSAESEEQLLQTAAALKEQGVSVLRAGIWKPRTHPGCFEGIGVEGLPWLSRVRTELGMKVCTEVAGAAHVKAVLEHGIDMVWIGARTTTNPFLVQEIAEALSGTGIPVLIKNPVSPDLGLWTGAIERFQRCGIRKTGLILRGFSTFEPIKYRNAPEWSSAVAMRSRRPDLPIFCDPSHMAGNREYIPELAQKAMDLGMDGLMIESHCNPDQALSDAAQQLVPSELGKILGSLRMGHDDGGCPDCELLGELRKKIDDIDDRIIKDLASRVEISRKIGRMKGDSGMSVIQSARWDTMMEGLLSKADSLRLDRETVRAIFETIHRNSISEQNKIIGNNDRKD